MSFFYLDHGRVIAQGTYDELSGNSEPFRDMVNATNELAIKSANAMHAVDLGKLNESESRWRRINRQSFVARRPQSWLVGRS